jgi:hypothetical protein
MKENDQSWTFENTGDDLSFMCQRSDLAMTRGFLQPIAIQILMI